MTDAGPVIAVDGLRKRYGDRTAVDGVSFTVGRGETVALLGPNGAGKSTTIEVLEGYRRRTSGAVSVLGVDPDRGGVDWKARIGIVLQSGGEAGTARVREQVAQFAAFFPHPRDVDGTLAAVGLTEHAKAPIRSLSGGQQRRLDVALGIIGRPELLFLDEPTTGFDPEARRAFWALIRELQQEGTSILLTTHYLDEAAELSDRAVIVAAGRVVADGPIDRVGPPDARVPIVRWREPDGGLRSERTASPGRFAAALVARTGGEPADLEIVRPSLEDVYLGLIRDGAAA